MALKYFATITESGSRLKDSRRYDVRAIKISIALCIVIYALAGFAVERN